MKKLPPSRSDSRLASRAQRGARRLLGWALAAALITGVTVAVVRAAPAEPKALEQPKRTKHTKKGRAA